MSYNKRQQHLQEFLEKKIQIKFAGGREVVGVLRGFDNTSNIVLDQCIEFERDPEDSSRRMLIVDPDNKDKMMEKTRKLGIVVCRGSAVMFICPDDGTQEIENPFQDDDDDEEEDADADLDAD